MYFDTYHYTNKGGRLYNEDCADYRIKGDCGMFILADGLGGHTHGQAAAQIVTKTFLNHLMEENIHDSRWFEAKVQEMNQAVCEQQKKNGSNMRSTMVALCVDKKSAVWAHVGDSRLYYLSEGKLKEITKDHSVAYTKYLLGEITKDQIALDADQSCLLRSIGGEKVTPDIRLWEEELKNGDGFLLCSDGLWEYLKDEEVLIDYLKSQNAKKWAEYMLLRVMERIPSNNDNMTLITLVLHE